MNDKQVADGSMFEIFDVDRTHRVGDLMTGLKYGHAQENVGTSLRAARLRLRITETGLVEFFL